MSSQRGCAKTFQLRTHTHTHAHTHTHTYTHSSRRTRAPRSRPRNSTPHTPACIAAPHAACHAQAVCRSKQKLGLSQARFECLPIFPPCLSQTGRESSKHCNRVPPHMKTQCVAVTGSVDRCFSHVGRRAEAWTVAWTVVFHTWTAWAMPFQNKLPPCAQAGRQFGWQFGNSDGNS